MKKFLAFTLLFSVKSFAQQVTPSLSAELDFEVKKVSLPIIQSGSNVYYYLTEYSTGFGARYGHFTASLARLDTTLANLKITDFNNGKNDFYHRVDALQIVNNKPWLLYFDYTPGKFYGNLLAAEIDTANVTTGTTKIIAAVADMQNKMKRDLEGRYIRFVTSPGGLKSATFISKGDGSYFVSVVDENMNIIWSREGYIVEHKNITEKSVAVDNGGNVYFAYKVGGRGVEAHICILHADGSAMQDFAAGEGDVQPLAIKLIPSKDGTKMHAVAWYYDDEPFYAKGVFYRAISTADFKAGSIVHKAIPADILTMAKKEGVAYKDSKGLGIEVETWGEPSAFELPDGSVDMLLLPSERGSFQTANIFTGSIINARVSANDVTIVRIPHYAVRGENQADNGICATSINGKVVILYNDKKENVNQDFDSKANKIAGLDNLSTIAATIDLEGNITRKVVADFSSRNLWAKLDNAFQLSNGRILVPFVYRGKLKLDKVTFVTISIE
jgi:hypothetical protein